MFVSAKGRIGTRRYASAEVPCDANAKRCAHQKRVRKIVHQLSPELKRKGIRIYEGFP
jgi:hypothetical protein